MMTVEMKRRMTKCGVFLVPVILVKGAGFLYGSGPTAGATAAEVIAPSLDSPTAVIASETITDENRKAAAKVAALYKQPFGESPLYYDAREAPTDGGPVVSVDPNAPTLIVQAILASTSGDTALISGKMYKVGDQFEKSGWTLTAIDNKSRTVTLKNAALNKEVTAAVRIND